MLTPAALLQELLAPRLTPEHCRQGFRWRTSAMSPCHWQRQRLSCNRRCGSFTACSGAAALHCLSQKPDSTTERERERERERQRKTIQIHLIALKELVRFVFGFADLGVESCGRCGICFVEIQLHRIRKNRYREPVWFKRYLRGSLMSLAETSA